MAGCLEGRVALITGGSRGFGRAIARAFAREGAYTPEWQRIRASQLPVRHLGSVDDVAYAALTLADNAAGYITGQILYVAGGAVMGL